MWYHGKINAWFDTLFQVEESICMWWCSNCQVVMMLLVSPFLVNFRKRNTDRQRVVSDLKGGCLPFIVLIIVHLMPKVELMFTYCVLWILCRAVLEDSKLVQLLDVGIDKVFPWIELLLLVCLHNNGNMPFILLLGSVWVTWSLLGYCLNWTTI